jgi:hypothetical protein
MNISYDIQVKIITTNVKYVNKHSITNIHTDNTPHQKEIALITRQI